MRMRWAVAALLAGLVGGLPFGAVDPPHWSSATVTIDCTTQCHTLHAAGGGVLTQAATNVTLCQSCHNATGLAMGLPVNNADKANPNSTGTSHAFDVAATNSACGATPPTNTAMAQRIMSGNVVCSTCHDQHAAVMSTGGTPHTGAAKLITALGSTGSVTSGGVYSGANGAWYLVEIVGGGPLGAATFRYSKDSGLSWWGWNGTAWVAYAANPRATSGGAILLDSGITAVFGAGNYSAGERWQFYGSWPFLRASLDSGNNASANKFCRDCHAAWAMSSQRVEGRDGTYPANGTNVFSHPVGEALARNYDRKSAAAPWDANLLDGNGAVQSVGDGNAHNDLKLDTLGDVQCLSCHAMHFAPSNTGAVIP